VCVGWVLAGPWWCACVRRAHCVCNAQTHIHTDTRTHMHTGRHGQRPQRAAAGVHAAPGRLRARELHGGQQLHWRAHVQHAALGRAALGGAAAARQQRHQRWPRGGGGGGGRSGLRPQKCAACARASGLWSAGGSKALSGWRQARQHAWRGCRGAQEHGGCGDGRALGRRCCAGRRLPGVWPSGELVAAGGLRVRASAPELLACGQLPGFL
jgi:hypothetical protein